MKMRRSVITSVLTAITMLSGLTNGHAVVATGEEAEVAIGPVPTVTLRAASGASIPFRTEDGSDSLPGGQEVAHLVLYRNGALTNPYERTLIVEVTDIRVPPPGVTVTLSVETQHGDPDPVGGSPSGSAQISRLSWIQGDSDRRIPVWREARWIPNAPGLADIGTTAIFTHTFEEAVSAGTETLPTPTDYFRYDLDVSGPSRPLHVAQDYAFLMENHWIAQLPEVPESSVGAAPDELIVYYADMFPFRKNARDPATWLPREDVPDYVHTELISGMIEAFRVQTAEWGFPWYRAWTSYRSGQDRERLSVALSDGRTWFHGEAPVRGHSGISLKVTGGDNAQYDTLTDGLISTFHHELFHNHQRNISLKESNSGAIAGKEGAWQFFSEGTAVLASSVGQPDVQFTSLSRAYVSRANYFIGDMGPMSDLNKSYEQLYPYNAAIYWRFLYEQCGQIGKGVVDSAAGMETIRRALTILYSGEVVDINASTDLITALPEIMNRALSGSRCPFDTYAESLTAFSHAVYSLRLDGGRCAAPGIPAGCGFYDPYGLYKDPPIETVIYSGEDSQHTGNIRSSFGMDFVHIALGRAADGQPLRLELHQAPGAAAKFAVQVRELKSLDKRLKLQPASSQGIDLRVLEKRNSTGEFSHVIPAVDRTEYDRLGLIITRIDVDEREDPVGAYTILLRPTEPNDLVCAPVSPTHC